MVGAAIVGPERQDAGMFGVGQRHIGLGYLAQGAGQHGTVGEDLFQPDLDNALAPGNQRAFARADRKAGDRLE